MTPPKTKVKLMEKKIIEDKPTAQNEATCIDESLKALEGKELTAEEIMKLDVVVYFDMKYLLYLGEGNYRNIARYNKETRAYGIGEWYRLPTPSP